MEKKRRIAYIFTMEDVRAEMEALAAKLRELQRAYYVDARPLASDLEYDRLFDELSRLEREHPELKDENSPTERVGSDLASDFPEVAHTIPVLSLDKAYTPEAVEAFIEKSERKAERNLSFVLEEKIDGLSLVLYYENGALVRALTRGNGFVGNDVTANARTIKSIPLVLTEPVDIAVRGEVFIRKADFIRLNENLDEPYANARNLAAGTLRRKTSAEVAPVPLDIFVYEGFYEGSADTDHVEILSYLKRLGFRTNPHISVFAESAGDARRKAETAGLETDFEGSFSDIPAVIRKKTEGREGLAYEIDGLVLKINETAIRAAMGYTEHHPRWAIAYKFEAPQSVSELLGIDVQIGRTGRVTPVARIRKVKIGNSEVQNVTLHNQDYINSLELAIGDSIAVSKRGDVIPAIESVLEKNTLGNTTWKLPTVCPECGSALTERGAHTFCPNPSCPAQISGRIEFFVSKDSMDIETLGPKTVGELIRLGAFRDVPDIYTCDYTAVLTGVPGFGEKKIKAIKDGVAASRKQPFLRVLVSLGIPEFGKKAASTLIDAGYDSMDALLALADGRETEKISSVYGLGDKTAQLLINALNEPEMRERIAALRDAGLKMHAEAEDKDVIDSSMAGEVWCVTGSIPGFKNPDLAMAEAEARGARIVSSVSSKTTHLLVGAKPGSKLEKARLLGTVKLVSPEEFMKLIGREEAGDVPDEDEESPSLF